MKDLEGRTALVTGSSSGIGRGIALCLAAHGADVWVHGRDEERVADVRRELDESGATSYGVRADLTDEEQVAKMREEVLAHGAPDILVTNAGGNPVPPGPIEEIPLDGWRQAVEMNLTATFQTIAAFLPEMKERGSGAIVTISSLAARMPNVRSPAAYSAAKAGIEALTRNLAVQAGPSGIRVNCVAPETILTEKNQQQIPDEMKSKLAESHPIQRLGEVEDVAEAVSFLASDRSSWISGEVIDVAGGPAG